MHLTGNTARALAFDLYRQSLAEVDIASMVADRLRDCKISGRVLLVATGKVAPEMAKGALMALGSQVVGGCVVSLSSLLQEAPRQLDPLVLIESAHPVPDERSERAVAQIRELLRASSADTTVIFLISGGSSAMLCTPRAGVEFANKVHWLERIAASGATIRELNAVRQYLSDVKGGRLLSDVAGRSLTLVVSDVVGDDLAVVGSGPTLPASVSWEGIREIVRARLPVGEVESFPRLAQRVELASARHEAKLLAGPKWFAAHVADVARRSGLRASVVDEPLVADFVDGTNALERAARTIKATECFVYYGEVTVATTGTVGTGGRAQHLAVSVVARGIPAGVAILCAGTDGLDGNSQAAGAVVDADTVTRLQERGYKPDRVLERCDSGTALGAAGDAFITGPSGLNFADIYLVVAAA